MNERFFQQVSTLLGRFPQSITSMIDGLSKAEGNEAHDFLSLRNLIKQGRDEKRLQSLYASAIGQMYKEQAF